MEEIGKLLGPDYLQIETYMILIMEANSQEFNIQCHDAAAAVNIIIISTSLTTVMCYWLFQVQPIRSMNKFCLSQHSEVSTLFFWALSLIPIVSLVKQM